MANSDTFLGGAFFGGGVAGLKQAGWKDVAVRSYVRTIWEEGDPLVGQTVDLPAEVEDISEWQVCLGLMLLKRAGYTVAKRDQLVKSTLEHIKVRMG